MLEYNNASLVQHAVKEALSTYAEKVMVVVGAEKDRIREELAQFSDNRVEVVENDRWTDGIASSIRAGIQRSVKASPSVEGVILMVCDQPFVNAALLHKIISVHRDGGKTIVACMYNGAVGTPVYFNHSYFNDLLKLTGDTGAKKIILKEPDNVGFVEFPQGDIDIDTEQDYVKLKNDNRQLQ